MGERAPSLGVVVIGRNEGERLRCCLNSLHDAAGWLVYVDSASDDDSVGTARSSDAEVVMLDMSSPFTAARARAEGYQRLVTLSPRLDYVMFVDGDCEVEKGWLETAMEFLDSHPDFAVVCGRRRERFPAASRYNALADREWNTPIGEAMSCGGDAVMRSTALSAVGGFDPAMIAGEEPELCRRLRAAGWRIMRLDTPMTIHDAAITRLGQWWARAVRSGLGYAQACHRTWRHPGAPLYCRELARAALWAGFLPSTSLLIAIVIHPVLFLVWPMAATAQYARMARREGHDAAALAMIGKFAELIGALRYALRLLRGSSGGTINYK